VRYSWAARLIGDSATVERIFTWTCDSIQGAH
jgi:hypothetical protein